MQIGELSRITGFSSDTIRYYEKLGLIHYDDNRTHLSSHKNYGEEILKRLIAIKQIKKFGFTLEETKSLFALFEEGVLEHERGKRYLQRKINSIDKKIRELEETRERLVAITGENEQDCTIHRILMSTLAKRPK